MSWTGPVSPALLTDLYELTMAAAYHQHGHDADASFELSVRRLPPSRRFLLVAGLNDALTGLEEFRFSAEDVNHLRGLELFPGPFLEMLADLRFTGDVDAMAEGEVAYAGEPLLRVTAPLIQAQIVETFLLNQVASQTLVASKAARVTLACGDRDFVDFSARRDHGASAALTAARSAWIAGAAGTSLVAGSTRWGLPLSGTMAHSYVMAFDDERDAFRSYARTFPDRAVLLVDTYDTPTGVANAIEVAHDLAPEGIHIAAVRLDSGDLLALSRHARDRLDAAGLTRTRVVASGDLDEDVIAGLLAADAPIDSFGVGTQMGTSADVPALSAIYKLVEDAKGPRMKLAEGKVSLPGRKQVWRGPDSDLLALEDEGPVAGHRPLLQPVMRGGQRNLTVAGQATDLAAARRRSQAALAQLPASVRSLDPVREDEPPPWPLRRSPGLERLTHTFVDGSATAPGPTPPTLP